MGKMGFIEISLLYHIELTDIFHHILIMPHLDSVELPNGTIQLFVVSKSVNKGIGQNFPN